MIVRARVPGFLEALSWLAILLDLTCLLILFFLVFGGAKHLDGDVDDV